MESTLLAAARGIDTAVQSPGLRTCQKALMKRLHACGGVHREQEKCHPLVAPIGSALCCSALSLSPPLALSAACQNNAKKPNDRIDIERPHGTRTRKSRRAD